MQTAAAILVIGLFMAIPLVMGGIARKRLLPTTEDFFVQGRAMGAFAFLGSNAFFYTLGPVYWTALAWNLLFGVLYFAVGKRIWFYGKKNGYITPSDFFRHQYGSPFLGIVSGLIPWKIGGLLFYAVIMIYVWAGGLRAVAWTDIFYGVLLFFGMVFAGFYIAARVGGPAQLFQALRQTAPEALTLPGPKGTAGPMLWVSMFIITPIGALMGTQLWTRMYAVKSSRLFNLMPFLLGFAAIAYIGSMLVGNTGIVLEPGVARADTILPVMLFKHAPFVLASLLCAGGAAAAMSTANSQIHAMSAVYTVDLHQRYFQPGLSQKGLVWVGRIAILVLVPTVGALVWRRSTTAGALTGLLVGVLLLALFTFVKGFKPPFGMHSGLACFIVDLVLFVVVSLVTPPRKKEVLDRWAEQKAIYDRSY